MRLLLFYSLEDANDRWSNSLHHKNGFGHLIFFRIYLTLQHFIRSVDQHVHGLKFRPWLRNASKVILSFELHYLDFCNISFFERGSERQKSLCRKVRTSKVSLIWSQRRKSKRSERQKYFQNVENHFVEKNVESKQMLDFRRSEIFWRHR